VCLEGTQLGTTKQMDWYVRYINNEEVLIIEVTEMLLLVKRFMKNCWLLGVGYGMVRVGGCYRSVLCIAPITGRVLIIDTSIITSRTISYLEVLLCSPDVVYICTNKDRSGLDLLERRMTQNITTIIGGVINSGIQMGGDMVGSEVAVRVCRCVRSYQTLLM